MSPALLEPKTATLYLEFHQPNEKWNAPLYDLAILFQSLNRLIADLAIVAHDAAPGSLVHGNADVDVISIQMQSPLKIALGVSRLAKPVVKAFQWVCEHTLFVAEEKDRRAAVAAQEWEDAYAKRLQNVRTAIDIASSAKQKGIMFPGHMDRLVEDVLKLERIDLRLKRLELDEGDS